MIAQIRPAAFSAWLTSLQGITPVLLDVREPWEISIASVKPLADAPAFDVLLMPMQSIPQRLQELPTDKPIVCLCHHGIRSQQVAAFLLHHGFEQVANLSGGMDAWSRELDASVAAY